MDAQSFDRLTAEAARHPTRRTALGLLGAALMSALLPASVARALQRPDSDGDGLFDDDESSIYGTDPTNPDSDGDNSTDGEEVYLDANPLVPDAAQRLDSDGDGLFDDDETGIYLTDPNDVDTDGDGVGDGEEIYNRDTGLAGPGDPLVPDGDTAPPDNGNQVPPPGHGMFLREICLPGVDVCASPNQCDAPTTRHTCSGTVAGVIAWCCVPPGGSCTECDCCGDYYCAFDDNNIPSCQPNPEG